MTMAARRRRLRRAALATPLIIVFIACWGPGREPPASSGPPITVPGTQEWYLANEPIVEEYLTTLPDSARGSVLNGIKLSDGRRWFAGFTYLGRVEGLPTGTNVAMFREHDKVMAFMWIAEDGEPLPLEACESGQNKGIRARKLAGQVYAWKALSPGHGVVVTPCPPDAWIP
jgi:hypothetical protein